MADLASAAYSAGFLGEEAKHTNWAQALGNTLGAASRTVGDVDRLLNAITTQEDEKVTRWVSGQLEGSTIGDHTSTGLLDDAYKAGVNDPENYSQKFTDAWDNNITVENIVNGAGVSEAAARRWLNEYGPEMRAKVESIGNSVQKEALWTKTSSTQLALGDMLAKDPSLSPEDSVKSYNESLNSLGLEPGSYEYWSLSLDNPANNIRWSNMKATALTKDSIEQNAKTGFMTKKDAQDYAENQFRQLAGKQTDPARQNEIDIQAEQIRVDTAAYYDEITTGIVNDSNARLTHGTEYLADQWAKNPEWYMNDEEFDRWIHDELGLDPDNNEIDRRNADLLYKAVQSGNVAASNAVVRDYLTPDVLADLDKALDASISSQASSGVVQNRKYTFTNNSAVATDAEGNVIQGAVVPSYTAVDTDYTSTSAAMNEIMTSYDRMRNINSGYTEEISTSFGDIVDQFPEEIRNNPEAFKSAIEYVNNRGASRISAQSEAMNSSAMAIATDTGLTQQEKRDQLSNLLANGVISQTAYNEAIKKVNFAYEEDRAAVSAMLESALYSATGSNDLYKEISSDLDFQNNLEKWILGTRTAGLTLTEGGVNNFIEKQVALFASNKLALEGRDASAKALSEIFDTDILVGNSSAFTTSSPAELKAMAENGDLALILRPDAVSNIRRQIALGDSSITTSMDDLRETGAASIYGKGYDELSNLQKKMVDVNVTLAVADQFDYEMLHDTFIKGQDIDKFTEVPIKVGETTTVGIMASDGFVYFLPNNTYDQNQPASFFYVGTDSEVYKNAMDGEGGVRNLNGYSIGSYTKPTSYELTQKRKAEGPKSLSEWRDFVTINPRGSISIDPRLWAVVGENNIDQLLSEVGKDPKYKKYYGQIQQGFNDHAAYNYEFDQSYDSAGAPANTTTNSLGAFIRDYSIADDPMFEVEKENIRDIQIRKNNA